MTSETSNTSKSTNGSSPHTEASGFGDQSQLGQTNGNDPLTASKRSKSEAEYARQNIANEILEAAKTVCDELIADAERALEKARYLEGEADRKHVEAHEERESAATIRQEAEEYRETLIEDAKRQAAEQIERARAAAERECSEMVERASIDSEKMMAQAKVMRAAALEEMEAQKIYAEAAKFQSASQETLNQARNRLGFARTSALLKPGASKPTGPPTSVEQRANGAVSDPGTDPAGHQGQIDRSIAMATGAISFESATGPTDGVKDAITSLVELRNMQEAASKAVDAAVAEERKPTRQKRTTKSKKTTTTKT